MALYRKIGFIKIAAYTVNPVAGSMILAFPF